MTQLVLIVSLLLALPAASPPARQQAHADRVVARRSISGRLARFEEGDYLHVVVKSKDGRETSFFLGTEACFLAENYDQTLAIRFVQVERYFPEGGGYYRANLIQSITVSRRKAKWKATGVSSSQGADSQQRCIQSLEERLGKPVSVQVPPK